MKAISRFLSVTVLAAICSGCGDAGIDITIDLPPPPGQPQVTVVGQTKRLVFSWAAVNGADHYRLMENPDGHSGFTQIADNIPAGTLTVSRDIAVHLFDWIEAQYMVEACNVTGCNSSDIVTATDVMLDTIGYIKASNTEANDGFGAVALSADGNTLAIGAPGEDSNAAGIDGDQSDNSVSGSGAVYVFRLGDTGWQQQAYIKASPTNAGDGFGRSVALTNDGDGMAVGSRGADGAGAVYVFRYDGSTWNQLARIKASNADVRDGFGGSIALSVDGNTLAVGATNEKSNATGINGDQDDNSADWAGAVYLFRFDGTEWYQQAYVKGSDTRFLDRFGIDVALSADGNTLAVGAQDADCLYYPNDFYGCFPGAAYLFRFDGTEWYEQHKFSDSGEDGYAVSLSADGNTLAVGATGDTDCNLGFCDPNNEYYFGYAGAVLVFRFADSTWTQESYLEVSNEGSDDLFGLGLALSADGNMLAVAAPRDDSNATGINGDPNDNSTYNTGAVYVLDFDGADWYQRTYIKASNPDDGDRLGSPALSADGNTLALSARGEDSNATGINGDQSDNSAEYSGAVYVY